MPRITSAPRGALSAVGTVRNFVTVMREMSFEKEREQAERLPRILVVAPDVTAAQSIGDALTGLDASPAISTWTLDNSNRSLDAYDAVVIFNPASNDTFIKARERSGMGGVKVFDLSSIEGDRERWASDLRERIAGTLPDFAPALGRWFPAFRAAATKSVINETARVNAQFALVSNIPAAIPILGTFAAVGADFFVLTKNQVMMVYKLAAIHGRDLHDHWAIMREISPVVGVGFAWRTLAREAAAFVPLMAGTLPKVAIAYTGTIAAGCGAGFYYRFGKKASREQLRDFYAQAAESLKGLSLQLPGRSKSAIGAVDLIEPSPLQTNSSDAQLRDR